MSAPAQKAKSDPGVFTVVGPGKNQQKLFLLAGNSKNGSKVSGAPQLFALLFIFSQTIAQPDEGKRRVSRPLSIAQVAKAAGCDRKHAWVIMTDAAERGLVKSYGYNSPESKSLGLTWGPKERQMLRYELLVENWEAAPYYEPPEMAEPDEPEEPEEPEEPAEPAAAEGKPVVIAAGKKTAPAAFSPQAPKYAFEVPAGSDPIQVSPPVVRSGVHIFKISVASKGVKQDTVGVQAHGAKSGPAEIDRLISEMADSYAIALSREEASRVIRELRPTDEEHWRQLYRLVRVNLERCKKQHRTFSPSWLYSPPKNAWRNIATEARERAEAVATPADGEFSCSPAAASPEYIAREIRRLRDLIRAADSSPADREYAERKLRELERAS